MNMKLVVLLGSVGAVHLVAGGLFLTGGCIQEDPPMPPGIYVPRQTNEQPGPATAAPGEPAAPVTTLPNEQPVQEPAVPGKNEPVPSTEPKVTGSKDSGHGDTVYIVVKNDSLWLLARKHGLTIEELASYNNLPANARLKVGQKLYIPAAGKKAVSGKPAGPRTKKAKAPAAKGKKNATRKTTSGKRGKNLPVDGIYTVKSGDNFSLIAKRHGLRVSDLIAANPGVDSSRLKIGQKLRLTADAAAVPAAKAASKKKSSAKKANAPAKTASAAPAADAKNAPQSAPSAADGDDLLKSVDDIKPDEKADSASNEAVKAVVPDRNDSMAVVPDKDRTETDTKNNTTSVIVGEDTTLEAFCKKYRITDKGTVRKLNPAIPADGRIKEGTRVLLIGAED